jgi:hypothetical protein
MQIKKSSPRFRHSFVLSIFICNFDDLDSWLLSENNVKILKVKQEHFQGRVVGRKNL